MPDKSIKNPNYEEWPELDYSHTSQYARNLQMFGKRGQVLYPPTKAMYEYIRDFCIDRVKNHPQYPKFNWKPKIVDVGCGGGFGSYIMSHEGDFVWGIDVDQESIRWAQTVFSRHKNGIYYSPQLSFDVIDVRTENRELMAFDIIACIEVIEHINQYEKLLEFIKRLCKRHKKSKELLERPDSTYVFISSPNRNHPKIGDNKPRNKRHVREWTPQELYDILSGYFKHITLLNCNGIKQDFNTKEAIVLFRCESPIE